MYWVETKHFVYQAAMTTTFLINETIDEIPPCFVALRGTFTETVISHITNWIEEPIKNEKDICFFTELDEQRRRCEIPSLR